VPHDPLTTTPRRWIQAKGRRLRVGLVDALTVERGRLAPLRGAARRVTPVGAADAALCITGWIKPAKMTCAAIDRVQAPLRQPVSVAYPSVIPATGDAGVLGLRQTAPVPGGEAGAVWCGAVPLVASGAS